MKWVALSWVIAAGLVRIPAPVVKTSSGLVRGRISHNQRFYEYFGIPYGTVDESNRFRAPLPPPSWRGVFDAHDEHSWCPQRACLNGIVIGEQDCLKLYIYSPVHKPNGLLPVMVYIHGGCFFEGTGAGFLYGGDNFAENDVVFVGINYRLNVEGFLCLGIDEAPGNAGLKDQLAALKWIRDNIRGFGGNPDDVTLFGESAGAVSTSFLILSPAAKGLFHKAILQSGSSLVPWGLQHDPIETASALVKHFGYDTKDPYEIYSILVNKSSTELISKLRKNEQRFCVADDYMFVPCVEKVLQGVDPVITNHPADVIKSGNYSKMPMIVGYTDNEGIYFVSTDYGISLKNGSTVDTSKVLKKDLVFPDQLEKNCTAQTVTKHYFSSYEDEMIMNVVDLYSDLYFKFPLIMEADMYARTSNQPIYYYQFKYSGLNNMPKFISGFGLMDGASHADELFYLFRPHGFPMPQRYLEEDMVQTMITLWTNFAKYIDPTPHKSGLPFTWLPSRAHNPTALVIDSRITTAPFWDPGPVALWNSTYNRYRRMNYGWEQYNTSDGLT